MEEVFTWRHKTTNIVGPDRLSSGRKLSPGLFIWSPYIFPSWCDLNIHPKYYIFGLSCESDVKTSFLFRAQKIKERCQKCQRKHFRNRNEKFCDSKCSADDEMDKDEMEVQTEAVTTTTSTEESSTADVKSVSSSTETSHNDDTMETETEAVVKSEDDEETMSEETTTKKAKGRRKNRNKNKNNKKKNKKNNGRRNHKNKKNSKKVSNLDNEDEHEWEYVDVETRKTGPLESFIKYLFKRSRK